MYTWQPIKGRPLSESEREPQIQCHLTNRFRVFSLYSVTIKILRNPEIHKNKEQCINPSFSRIKIQANSMKSAAILRDSALNLHHWTVSSTIQARIHHWWWQTQVRSQRKKLRRREKEDSKDLNRWRRRREITDLFSDSNQKINKTESKSKSSWRFWFEPPIKTQVNT